MLIKRLVSGLTLGAVLLAAGAGLPAVAHAHDGEYGDRQYHDRDDDHRWERHHDEHRWERRHWDQRYTYPNGPQVYDRYYVEPYYAAPRVYYAPGYVYPQPEEGVTIFFRNHW